MSMDKEKLLTEQLSRCIDKMNNRQDYFPNEREVAELMEVADLVKKTVSLPVAPQALIKQTVDVLAVELKAKQTKKRRKWLLSGSLGTAAAALLVAVMQLHNITPQQPQTYLPPLEGTVIIEQVAQAPSDTAGQAAHDKGVVPPPAVENKTNTEARQAAQPPAANDARVAPAMPKPASEQMPAKIASDKPAKQPPQADVRSGRIAADTPALPQTPAKAEAQTEKPKTAMIALAGRQARSVEVDTGGTIKQVYDMGDVGEVIITEKPKAASAPQPEMGTAAAVTKKASPRTLAGSPTEGEGTVNKVTVNVGDKEVTLEGRISKEELLKLAETLTSE